MNKRALVINCSPVRTGATAEIVNIIGEELAQRYEVRSICIDDYSFAFCRGCRSCHLTGECVIDDDAKKIVEEFERADVIVSVAPSYWADIPGQFKAFIDRCTPWCDTHEPHATIGDGKRGYSVALRTGPGMHECERIIKTIEHFYGHLKIEQAGYLGLTSVECRNDVFPRGSEIRKFCGQI